MQVTFANHRLATLLKNEALMMKRFGIQAARKAVLRIIALRRAPNLHGLSPEGRPHPLHGERKGQFAIHLCRKLRLVFKPDHDPLPCLEDGGH